MGMETLKENRSVDIDRSVGRDDHNLIEFPFFCITKPEDFQANTITFSDEFKNKQTGKTETRTLKIVASEEYGLPDVHCADVWTAINSMHRQSVDPKSAHIHFSQYELLDFMEWPKSKHYYKLLDRCCDILTATSYHYTNWWNPETETYGNRKFNIISEATLVSSRRTTDQPELALSHIEFTQSYMRAIAEGWNNSPDPRLFFAVRSAIAKQGVRFFDKRLRVGRTDDFELYRLATKHLGMKGTTKNGKRLPPSKLIERLEKPFAELVSVGLLEDLPHARRFVKDNNGETRVFVTKGRPRTKETKIIDALVAEGVSEGVAKTFVTDNDIANSHIEKMIEYVQWLEADADEKTPKDKAAVLYKAITEEWKTPERFKTKAEREAEAEAAAKAQEERKAQLAAAEKAKQAEEQKQREKTAADWKAIENYLASLSPQEHEECVEAAFRTLGNASWIKAAREYHRTKQGDNAWYDAALRRHILPLLEAETVA